jgi:hypothetical protein
MHAQQAAAKIRRVPVANTREAFDPRILSVGRLFRSQALQTGVVRLTLL